MGVCNVGHFNDAATHDDDDAIKLYSFSGGSYKRDNNEQCVQCTSLFPLILTEDVLQVRHSRVQRVQGKEN